MEQHPDRQPRRAKAMERGNNHDRDADQKFDGKWIQE
jgi:hypothetical protein